MADRRHDHVDLVDSIEVQPPCKSKRLDNNATSVSIANVLTIPCAVSGNIEGSRHASSQIYSQTGGTIFEDRQTIDELFSFINESGESEFENTRAEWVANMPCGAQSSHRSRIQTDFSVPKSLNRHVHQLPLSTIKHSSINSTSVKSENIDNYNIMDKVKQSSPTKEIDVFLPEEETIDLSLTTRSWKGRTPPSHLIYIDISDDAVESVGTVDDSKISNYAADPPDQPNEQRMRSGSFENIPGTGKYINTIPIRRDSSSARPSVTKERKISRERKHLKTHQKPTIKNDGCKSNEITQAQNLLISSRRKSEKRDEPVSTGIGNSLIVDLEKDDKRMLEKSNGTRSSPLEGITMRKTTPAGHHKQMSRLSNNRHRDTVDAKEEFSIYGVVTQANVPSIRSLNIVPNDIQVSVSTHDQQSAVMRPIMSSHAVANTELNKQLKHNQRTSPQPTNPTLRQARDENINVYVNVNVNMNNNDYDQKLQRTKHYPSFKKMDLASTDVSDPLIQYHDFSDSTEKSQTSSLFSDDELSSGKSESSSQSEYASDFTKDPRDRLNNQALQLPSNISGNRFRISSQLGPGGLSPIPSESYESDSTSYQVDASGYEHGKKSPTLSEYSTPSSNTTITCDISDNEMDGMSSTRRASAKRQRGTHRSTMPSPMSRKISYEENEATVRKLADVDDGTSGHLEDWRETEYDIRTPISRSYSQPEHFMLAKRQTEIDKMRPNMAHHDTHGGIHTRLDKTSSEPLPSSRIGLVKKDGKDDRLPLNVQLATDILSSEDNDGSMAGTNRSDLDSLNAIARHDIRRSSWQLKSPYSSRVSRTSSMLSEGSRSGRRTRQLSVDIGEEWENVHQTQRARTVSDVGSVSSGVSYRSLRTKRIYADKLGGTGDLINSNIPGIDQNLIQPPHRADEFVPSDLHVTEEIASPFAELREGAQDGSRPIVDTANPVVIQVTSDTKEDLQYIVSTETRILLDNPYNSINQRFHSTLHCPCFLFFCFLCCAPAVYWMQRSDYEFDYASETLAKRFGRRATVLYITGAAMSIILLSAAILMIYLLLEDEILKGFT